jgi:hypothetical protein
MEAQNGEGEAKTACVARGRCARDNDNVRKRASLGVYVHCVTDKRQRFIVQCIEINLQSQRGIKEQ